MKRTIYKIIITAIVFFFVYVLLTGKPFTWIIILFLLGLLEALFLSQLFEELKEKDEKTREKISDVRQK
ncbi:MAG: hypothetical protein ACLUJI_01340 [Faecalibacillus faecis]|uniref:hypothetical protein n=1 Tax=Faecalibacillus faecis TaxID=1982628 RepID=UPI003996C921